jgi:hypothetical protein
MSAPEDDREVLEKMVLPIGGEDNPTANITALVQVTKTICQALDKPPTDGVLMLMTAAAFILDTDVEGQAAKAGKPVDYGRLVEFYLDMCIKGWNANGFLFRGAEPAPSGTVRVSMGNGRGKATLQ